MSQIMPASSEGSDVSTIQKRQYPLPTKFMHIISCHHCTLSQTAANKNHGNLILLSAQADLNQRESWKFENPISPLLLPANRDPASECERTNVFCLNPLPFVLFIVLALREKRRMVLSDLLVS